MSVIVKGMNMPKACMYCPMFNGMGCKAAMKMFDELTNVAVRVKGCPLVTLPEKHGRLIDADSLRENIESFGGILPEEINTFLMILEQEKTIIESEE